MPYEPHAVVSSFMLCSYIIQSFLRSEFCNIRACARRQLVGRIVAVLYLKQQAFSPQLLQVLI